MANYDVESQTSLVQKNVLIFDFWHPMLVRPAMKRLFFLKAKNGLGRFAPSALPHNKYDTVRIVTLHLVVTTRGGHVMPRWRRAYCNAYQVQ